MRLGRMAMRLGGMFSRGGVFAFSVCLRGGTVGFRRLFMVLGGLCMGLFRHGYLHGEFRFEKYSQDKYFQAISLAIGAGPRSYTMPSRLSWRTITRAGTLCHRLPSYEDRAVGCHAPAKGGRETARDIRA